MDTDVNSSEEAVIRGEESRSDSTTFVGCVGLLIVGVVALLIAVGVSILSFASSDQGGDSLPVFVEDEEFFDEDIEEPELSRPRWGVDVGALTFDDVPKPTLEVQLADLATERILEIEFFLPPGDGDISFAIRNPEPIRIDGQGIAVRTNDFAQILRSSEAFEMPRPAECIDGQCRLFMWLTMGPQFLGEHPEAELLIWAGEGAAVTIESMPMDNIRDETYR